MFSNLGGQEVLVVAVVALIAVGPEQLPGVIRRIGRWVAQARSMTTSLRDEFMAGVDEETGREIKQLTTNPEKWLRGLGTDDDPVVPRGAGTNVDGESQDEPDDQDDELDEYNEYDDGNYDDAEFDDAEFDDADYNGEDYDGKSDDPESGIESEAITGESAASSERHQPSPENEEVAE